MKCIFLFPILLGLMACPGNNQPTSQAGAIDSTPKDWQYLLEGDLSKNWEMYNQDSIKGWTLEGNELTSSGAGWDQNEDLITKEVYDNFELYLEWKIAPENSSGIFFHVQKDSLKPIYESAPEYQLMDDKGWPQKMKPNQYTGASYAMYAPEGAVLNPVGQWNTTRIIVNHPNIQHWLNGVKVVDYDIGSEDWQVRKAADKWASVPQYGQAKSGHIGLQNAGKISFREIKIRKP